MPDHIGREISIQALGQTWTFTRCGREVWIEFALHARTVLPDPIAAAMRNIDTVIAKDAEALRKIILADKAETEAAQKEEREPVLLADKFIPISDMLTQKALDKSCNYAGLGTPEVNSYATTPEGSSYLFSLLLKKHHPDMTPDKAFDLVTHIPKDEQRRILQIAEGKVKATEKNG